MPQTKATPADRPANAPATDTALIATPAAADDKPTGRAATPADKPTPPAPADNPTPAPASSPPASDDKPTDAAKTSADKTVTPPAKTTPAPPSDVDAAGEETGPQAGADRWGRLLADPVHTPEILALAAVSTIGPRAKVWAAETSAAYPAATPAGLARLATRQFTRFGALASVFGALAGSYASIALVSTRALTEAELVLHLAAALGFDPTDPRRAVDLLVITRVHESVAEAEQALADQPATSGLGDAALRMGRVFVQRSGGWTILRAINRYYPGVSLLGAVLTSASDAQATAARAVRYYTQLSQDSGSRA